jgi:alpha-glucosidase
MRRSTHVPQFAVPAGAPPVFEPPGIARIVEQTDHSVRLKTGSATVEVMALAPDLFRVGLFGDGGRVDYRSEAVTQREWRSDDVRVESRGEGIRISTALTTAHVSLAPVRIGFADS